MKQESIFEILFKFSYGSWIQALISILSLPLFARYLTPSEFAVISLFVLVYNLAVAIIFLGVDQAFIRFYNQYVDKIKFINSYLLISLLSLFFFSVIIFLFEESIAEYILSKESWLLIGMLILHLFSGVLFRYITLVLRCENLSILFSNSQIFISVSYVVLSLLCIFFYKNAYSLIIGTVLSQLFVVLYLLFKVKYLFVFNLSKNLLDKKFIKEIFNYSLPYIPIIFLSWVFLNFDKNFLRKEADFQSLGIYFSAFKIVYGLNIIQIGFKSFWFPYAMKEYEKGEQSLTEFGEISTFLIFGFTFVILIMSALRNYIILIFPIDYFDVSKIFPILLIIPFMLTLYDVVTFGVNYYKKTYFHILTNVIALVIGIPLAFFLIPTYLLYGAALASVVTCLIYFICGVIFNNFFIKSFVNWNYLILNIVLIMVSGVSAFFNNSVSNYISTVMFMFFLIFNIQLIRKVYSMLINQFLNFKK